MMDPNSVKVKTEAIDAAAGGGGAAKPKFVPKAPVKKDSKPEAAASAQPVDVSSSSQGKSKDQGKDRRGRKDDNRDGGRGGRGGGRGFGGGRGQWVMPTGAAFFTGNASTALASKVNSGITIPVKAETSGRIARPNEIIDDVISVKTGTSVEKKSNLNRVNNQDAEVISIGDDSAAPFVPMQVEEDTDSDASVHEDEEDNNNHNLGVEGLEVWPPKHYDSTAPLSLPFGPKTATMRKILAAQPILADPSDPVAVMNEEQQSLFLLQLPSDLNFDQMMNPNNAEVSSSSSSAQESANSASTEHQAPKVLPNGKLGKLRLYKSGKVKLVTENGNEYDVNAGLAACFLQCLMSVEVPPPDDDDVIHVKAEGGEATSSSSVNKKTNNKTKDNVLVGKEGKLCFLGNVTKKLVVTPDYELGIRRKKQVTSAPSNTNLTTHVKEEIHEGTTDDMVMDEDDGGDMYDDDT